MLWNHHVLLLTSSPYNPNLFKHGRLSHICHHVLPIALNDHLEIFSICCFCTTRWNPLLATCLWEMKKKLLCKEKKWGNYSWWLDPIMYQMRSWKRSKDRNAKGMCVLWVPCTSGESFCEWVIPYLSKIQVLTCEKFSLMT